MVLAWLGDNLIAARRHFVHIEVAGYVLQPLDFDRFIFASVDRNKRLNVPVAECVQESVFENDRAKLYG